MSAVRRRRFAERQRFGTDSADHRVDDIQHRLGRTEARGDRKIAKFACPALEEGERVLAVQRPCETLEFLARGLESSRVGALEPVDGLLQVTDYEQGPVTLLAFARSGEI